MISKLQSLKHYFKPKKVSPSGLVILFGQRGSGKTTNIAHDYLSLYKKYDKGKCPYKHFYTNVKLYNTEDTDFYKYIDLNRYKLSDYIDPTISECKISTYNECKDKPPFTIGRNCCIYIDEMGTIAHARNYKTFPIEIINLTKMVRHLGIYLVCNSQCYDIDKTLRTGANELRLMRKILLWNYSRLITKEIKICKDKENADEQVGDHIELAKIWKPRAIRIIFIPFYTDLFNTFE